VGTLAQYLLWNIMPIGDKENENFVQSNVAIVADAW
jgi:hypothetical protein